MNSSPTLPTTIDEYIAGFQPPIRKRLRQMRRAIREAAPEALEAIKYRLPTFVQNGNLVHFGAFKDHIGFYATPSGNDKFTRELAPYEGGRGSVRFPHDKPLPLDLVRRIVKYRVEENSAKTTRRRSR